MEAEQAPVQVGQFILAKNLGIGAFGKVRRSSVDGWSAREDGSFHFA